MKFQKIFLRNLFVGAVFSLASLPLSSQNASDRLHPKMVEDQMSWTNPDGKTVAVNSVKWDFDHDGYSEMIYILGNDGHADVKIYDFNADGEIDLIKKREEPTEEQ